MLEVRYSNDQTSMRFSSNHDSFYYHHQIGSIHLSHCSFMLEVRYSNDQTSMRFLSNHDSFYYHHKIGSIHLSHCCHNFLWSFVWGGYKIIFSHLLHLCPGAAGSLFPLLMCSLWCMQMMMSSNGIIFRVTGHLCGEFTGVTRSFDVLFDLRMNKRLSK